MKRHLNTSYRLVWNHITGTLVVASELARSRGKRAGVAIVLSLAAVTSVPALAADTVVQAVETVSGGTLTNHDNQIVLGTANGMTISTGLEYGPDNEANNRAEMSPEAAGIPPPFSPECSVPVREKAECRPYPIHGRAPFCRPASPQTAPADVPGAGCVARNTHPQTGHGHRL